MARTIHPGIGIACGSTVCGVPVKVTKTRHGRASIGQGIAAMPFMPFQILGIWFRGLLSIAILAGGIYLLKRWYDESHVVEPAPTVPAAEATARDGDARDRDATAVVPRRRVFRFEPGLNRETAYLA